MFVWYDTAGTGKFFVSGPFQWAMWGENAPNECNLMVPPNTWDCDNPYV